MSESEHKIYEFGSFRLNTAERLLWQGEQSITLPPKVYETLLLLVENAGRVVTEDEFHEKIWGDAFVDEGSLTVNISNLRKLLGKDQSVSKFIETVPRVGYRFAAPVREITAEENQTEILATDNESTSRTKEIVVEDSQQKASENKADSTEAQASQIPQTERASAAQVAAKTNRLFSPVFWLSVLLICGGVVFGVYLFQRESAPKAQNISEINSIAVMPVANETGDANFDYLTDGLTDNLIGRLARLQRLKVSARSVVIKYKGKEIDPLKAGRELSVGAILVGRTTKENDALGFRLELVETATGRVLWSENYKRHTSEMLNLQDEIANRIIENLNLKLNAEDYQQLAKRYTENSEAYVLYLRGRFFWRRDTKDGLEKAIDYYNQAISLDPNYALAYAGIADCYNFSNDYAGGDPKDYFPKARTAALKALEIDETLVEAHTALAWTKFVFDWDWNGAEKEFQRAIELNSNNARAHAWHSILLRSVGRYEEALTEGKRAIEIEPTYFNMILGISFHYFRRYDEAILSMETSLKLHPKIYMTHWWLYRVYRAKGMKEQALAHMKQACLINKEVNPDIVLASCAKVDFNRGWKSSHQQIIKILSEESKTRYYDPLFIATYYLAFDDKEKAIESLYKAYDVRSSNLPYLATDPVWDDLRSDPRFQELLRRMNLENVKPAPQQ